MQYAATEKTYSLNKDRSRLFSSHAINRFWSVKTTNTTERARTKHENDQPPPHSGKEERNSQTVSQPSNVLLQCSPRSPPPAPYITMTKLNRHVTPMTNPYQSISTMTLREKIPALRLAGGRFMMFAAGASTPSPTAGKEAVTLHRKKAC